MNQNNQYRFKINRLYLSKSLIYVFIVILPIYCFFTLAMAENESNEYLNQVILSGKTLTIADVVSVARNNAHITISDTSLKLVDASNNIVKSAIAKNASAYGLKKITDSWQESIDVSEITPGEKEPPALEDPNIKTLIALSQKSGVTFNKELVRAAMLIRLNTILTGSTGATVELTAILRDFLNQNIIPVSVDPSPFIKKELINQSIIALTMTGKGMVYYNGKKVTAAVALKQAGIKPIRFTAIDAHTMLETNSIAVAYAVLIINDISLLIDNAEIIFSMAQEGCGGSISSLYETNLKAQPYKGLLKSALRINQHLTGSYILQGSNVLINNKENIDLSTGIWELGRARETYDLIEKNITIRLNSPDADPIVQVDFDSSLDNPSLKSIYSIKTKNLTGMVYPSLAQDEIFWSLDIVNLTKALAGISSASTVRIEAMQSKGVLSKGSDRHLANHIEQLNDDIKRYSVRVLFPDYTLKNNTNMINSDFAAAYDQLQIIIEKLYYIITTEAIMTAQMMDLKKKENAPAQFTFGIGTTAALEALRTQVPFIEKENQFVKYINKAFQFIKSGELKKALMK